MLPKGAVPVGARVVKGRVVGLEEGMIQEEGTAAEAQSGQRPGGAMRPWRGTAQDLDHALVPGRIARTQYALECTEIVGTHLRCAIGGTGNAASAMSARIVRRVSLATSYKLAARLAAIGRKTARSGTRAAIRFGMFAMNVIRGLTVRLDKSAMLVRVFPVSPSPGVTIRALKALITPVTGLLSQKGMDSHLSDIAGFL